MSRNRKPVRIDILLNHMARLKPFLPELQDRLIDLAVEFSASGPFGHAVEPIYTDTFVERLREWHYHAKSQKSQGILVQRLPLGRIPAVLEWLEEQGYDVELHDLRSDSPNWCIEHDWRKRVPRKLHATMVAVAAHRALRLIGSHTESIADTCLAIARSYPSARIAIGVSTHRQLRRIADRLRGQLEGEPFGIYTSKRKRAARVSLGLIRHLPRGNNGQCDLLVLPFVHETLGDSALERIVSGQYRRIVSFTPFRLCTDRNLSLRLEVVAEAVFPPPKTRIPISAVILPAHGTKPETQFANPFEAKNALYWQNRRRNRRIAEVARQLLLKTKRSIRSIGIDDEEVVQFIQKAAKTGVTILVETPVHARELAMELPGWAISIAGELTVAKPKAGCGILTTELAAYETVIRAGILIRATGTRWPLADINWPWINDVAHGILIDFRDQYHPSAKTDAASRVEYYRENGICVYEVKSGKPEPQKAIP